MRRSCVIAVVLAVFVSSCDRGGEPAAPRPSGASNPSPAPTVPAAIPISFDEDVAAADLPVSDLVPQGTEVTDRLLATTASGDAVVIMYAKRDGDPFMRVQGFVVWRRTAGAFPPWRPVFGQTHPKTDGILAIQGITGDATGDGSDDALIFEATGGVGDCGRWRVIDLEAGAQRWHRSLCDAHVDLGVDPPGLVLTETVYEPGDAHCCPSAIRTSTLEYRPDDGFVTTSEDSTAF